MKRRLAVAFLLAAVASGCTTGPPIVRQVTSANEFQLQNGDRYRLAGLRAPRPDHPMAETCRTMCAKLLLDRKVKLVLDESDTGEPPAAFAYTTIGLDPEKQQFLFVNQEMLLYGWAWGSAPPGDTTFGEHYAGMKKAEEIAQERRLGLWSQSEGGP